MTVISSTLTSLTTELLNLTLLQSMHIYYKLYMYTMILPVHHEALQSTDTQKDTWHCKKEFFFHLLYLEKCPAKAMQYKIIIQKTWKEISEVIPIKEIN